MEGFFGVINDGLVAIDDFIWGVPLMVLILLCMSILNQFDTDGDREGMLV